MSLQGSLDTFEIPDVLRLLSSTKKTGHLSLSGNRGVGSLWVKDGDIVHAEASAAPWASNSAEVVFEFLRYSSGDFSFYAEDTVDDNGKKPEKVEPVLNSANSMLQEWESIEKIVPSLASPLRLAGKLPEPSVEINEASWRMIVGIGSGTTVGELGNLLEQSEIVVSRNVKQLIEAKLVEIEYAAPVLPDGRPLGANDTPQAIMKEAGNPFSEVASGENVDSYGFVESESHGSTGEDAVYAQTITEQGAVEYDAFSGGDVIEESAYLVEEQGSPGPFDFAANEEVYHDENIDLDDPVQIAKAIEKMSPEITRSVTLAARAETQEERESIMQDIQQRVSPLDFAVVQRFVYSLL